MAAPHLHGCLFGWGSISRLCRFESDVETKQNRSGRRPAGLPKIMARPREQLREQPPWLAGSLALRVAQQPWPTGQLLLSLSLSPRPSVCLLSLRVLKISAKLSLKNLILVGWIE